MSFFWQLLFWLIYFLSPIDVVPDVLPGVGWVDDFLLLLLLYWFSWRKSRAGYAGNWEEAAAEGEKTGDKESSRFQQQRSEQQKVRDPYAILGVDRSATAEEIKRAYHAQAGRYHPDKVSHLGREFQDLAHTKFQDIQWAYEQLHHGRKKAS